MVHSRRVRMGFVSVVLTVAVGVAYAPVVSAQQPVPPDVVQRLAPDCPAWYTAGARQLTLQQPTRIEMVCRVTNPLAEAVDYAGAMAFTLGEQARMAEWAALRGQMSAAGNQMRWSDFVLNPGESASATVVIEVTPVTADAGRPVVLFTGARMAARTASGGFAEVALRPITTETVAGLLSGGFVLSSGTGSTARMTVPTSPRTGSGVGQEGPARPELLIPMLVGLLALVLCAAVVSARFLIGNAGETGPRHRRRLGGHE